MFQLKGQQAEQSVADTLQRRGLEIVISNWRHRRAEIDIVAKSKNKIYFVEVKYRQNSDFGSGADYVNPRKMKQMVYAAQLFLSYHDYGLLEPHLLVAEVTGDLENIQLYQVFG